MEKFFLGQLFVGALIGIGLTFLLNLLSVAIGISIFSDQSNDTISFSILGMVGFLLVAIVSMFITGWVAGRLSFYLLYEGAGLFIRL